MTQYPVVKLEIFIPEEFVEPLAEAVCAAGAGRIGSYDHCMSVTAVRGSWRPLPGSQPYLGEIGKIQYGAECKVEINCPWECVNAVLRAVRSVHPYEEPLIQVVPLLNHIFD